MSSNLLRFDDNRRDKSEHALRALRVREYMAVEGPGTRLSSLHQNVVAVARCYVHRVAHVGRVHGPAIASDYKLRHAMQMHRVVHHALIEVTDQHPLSLFGLERFGGRKAL